LFYFDVATFPVVLDVLVIAVAVVAVTVAVVLLLFTCYSVVLLMLLLLLYFKVHATLLRSCCFLSSMIGFKNGFVFVYVIGVNTKLIRPNSIKDN